MANILQPDGLWAGCKLARCTWDAQLHFPRVYVYSDHYACFEMDLDKMYGTIYVKALNHVSFDDFKGFLMEYQEHGLLFAWDEHGKDFGYFPGPSSGRLAPPSLRHKRQTPEPPHDELRSYCNKYNILSDSVLDAYPMPSETLDTPYPHGRTKYKDKDNGKGKIDKGRSKKAPDPVDNSFTQDDEIIEKIDSLREKLYKTYWKDPKDNVHQWFLMQVKLKTKPRAMLYCLMAVDKKRPSNPWAYTETVLQDYNDSKFFRKEGDIFKQIVDKLKDL